VVVRQDFLQRLISWRKSIKVVTILERGEVLQKSASPVVDGVMQHTCFEPNELVKFYPRGEKNYEVLFHQFCSRTIEWFEGVELKVKLMDVCFLFQIRRKLSSIVFYKLRPN
jgi:hypothetical protein